MKRTALDSLTYQPTNTLKDNNFYSSEELIQVVNSGFPMDILKKAEWIKKCLQGTIVKIKPWVETGVPF